MIAVDRVSCTAVAAIRPDGGAISRSHPNIACQAPLAAWHPAWRVPPDGREHTGLDPEAAPSPVKPACRLARARFGAINAPKHAVPPRQMPHAGARPCGLTRSGCLTSSPRLSSTTGSSGPPRPSSIAERKASQSLPAFKPRPRAGVVVASKAAAPKTCRRAPVPHPDSRKAERSRSACRTEIVANVHPMHVPDSVITPSTRARTHQVVVLAPLGLPTCSRSNARPALDIRSRGGPHRVDDATNQGLIHRGRET